jgi:hypothetical protein
MDTQPSEQALRGEAVRRRLQGERFGDICQALHRSPRWLNKWWREFQRHPDTDFTDHSRAPLRSPRRLTPEVEQVIVATRQALEAGATPATRYGLLGAPAIRGQLQRLQVEPLPSAATIQRVLARRGLTHPVGAGHDAAYYPWPVAWEINAIQATDIITKHLRGGGVVQNFHTIDLASHAVCLTEHADKSGASARAHLLRAWAELGRPFLQQFDNESTFGGGPVRPRVLGQVVRLCLFCQVEPLFIPVYEAKRNYQIETFHSLWVAAFWSRQEFASLPQVRCEVPLFLRWYRTEYRPPALEGRTPAQMRRGFVPLRLTRYLTPLIPAGRLPLTAGRIHVVRKVDGQGRVMLFNEPWLVGKRWMGEYVRATINTAQERVSFWYQADAQGDWRCLKALRFRLGETVHRALPVLRRQSERCLERFPG